MASKQRKLQPLPAELPALRSRHSRAGSPCSAEGSSLDVLLSSGNVEEALIGLEDRTHRL